MTFPSFLQPCNQAILTPCKSIRISHQTHLKTHYNLLRFAMSYFEIKCESGNKHIALQPDFMYTGRRQSNGQPNKAHHRRRITRRRIFVKQSPQFTQQQNHLQAKTSRKTNYFFDCHVHQIFSQLVIFLAILFCKKTTKPSMYNEGLPPFLTNCNQAWKFFFLPCTLKIWNDILFSLTLISSECKKLDQM